MTTKKRHYIVIEKLGDKGMEYYRDEVLHESEHNGNILFSTACSGTIVIKPNETVFGPNCPDGVAVYDKF